MEALPNRRSARSLPNGRFSPFATWGNSAALPPRPSASPGALGRCQDVSRGAVREAAKAGNGRVHRGVPAHLAAAKRRTCRQLSLDLCRLGGPNHLVADKVQAALAFAEHLTVPTPGQSAAEAQWQQVDLRSMISRCLAAYRRLKAAVEDVIGVMREAGEEAGEYSGAAQGVAAVMEELRAMEATGQALVRMELLLLCTAQTSVSQMEALVLHHQAAYKCWALASSSEAIASDRRKYLKQLLRLAPGEAGEELMELFEKVRVTVVASVEAGAQRDGLSAEVRRMQSRLLASGVAGVTGQRLVAGEVDFLVERDLLRLYTLLRIIQNLKAGVVGAVAELRAAVRGSSAGCMGRASLGRLMAQMAALDGLVASATAACAGALDGAALPHLLSPRLVANCLAQELARLPQVLQRNLGDGHGQALLGRPAQPLHRRSPLASTNLKREAPDAGPDSGGGTPAAKRLAMELSLGLGAGAGCGTSLEERLAQARLTLAAAPARPSSRASEPTMVRARRVWPGGAVAPADEVPAGQDAAPAAAAGGGLSALHQAAWQQALGLQGSSSSSSAYAQVLQLLAQQQQQQQQQPARQATHTPSGRQWPGQLDAAAQYLLLQQLQKAGGQPQGGTG